MAINDEFSRSRTGITITGTARSDDIKGTSRNDVLDGGAGSDTIDAGSGNDLLIYRLSENTGARDRYDGGSGVDTLRLEFTAAEWARADVRADITRFMAALQKVTVRGEETEGNSNWFSFKAFGLEVRKIEMLEIRVDGVVVDPLGNTSPAPVANADVANVAEGAAVSGNVLANDQATNATVSLVSNVTRGTLVLNANGSYTFTAGPAFEVLANGQSTTETFTYRITDAQGRTATAGVTITVAGTNDAAVITGTSTASLTETNAAQSASGQLNVTDVDGAASFIAQSGAAGQYGSFSINAAGAWTYTMGAAHDEFVAGQTYSDSFTVATADGTTQVVTVNIAGSNDAAVITGTSTASLTETNAAQSVSGQLNVTDVDGAASFVAQSGAAGLYGSFSIDAAGAWTYTMDAAHDEFVAGQNYTDSFTVAAADGTTQVITVTITGTNDAAVITGTSTASLTETNAAQSASGQLNVTDVDGAASFVAQSGTAGQYGSFSIDSKGAWTYTMGSAHDEFVAGQTYSDNFTVAAVDGTAQVITVTITGTNDAAVITGTSTASLTETNAAQSASGQLNVTDVDGAASFVAQSGTAGLYGSFSIDAAGAWTYTMDAAHDEFVAGQTYSDNFTVAAADGTTQVVTVNIAGTNDAAVISGFFTGSIETDAPLTITGKLDVSDIDGLDEFIAQSGIAGVNGRGSFAIDTAGNWTFTANSAFNELAVGQYLIDYAEVSAADGTRQLISITINGSNDGPVISAGAVTGVVTEDVADTVTGQLTATDPDTGAQQFWTVEGGNRTGNADFEFFADSLTITRNGSAVFQDDFGDGIAPPVGPDGISEQYAGLGLSGLGEVGGRLVLKGEGAQLLVGISNNEPVVGVNALVNTGIAADLPNVLDSSANFTASAVFDLVLPDRSRESYGIRFTDRVIGGDGVTPDQLGDNVVHLRVQESDASLLVRLQQRSYVADRTITLGSVPLIVPEGADQIRMNLTHDAASAGRVVASFEYLANGIVIGSHTFAATGTIFQGENFTRAEIIGSGPGVNDSGTGGTYGTLNVDQGGGWTYTLNDGLMSTQSLGVGQIAFDTFTLRVTDEHGASDTETVTVTVTGTNDVPVVQTGTVSRTLQEDAGTSLVASGAGQFNDVDLVDTHAVAAVLVQASLSGGALLPTGLQELLDRAVAVTMPDDARDDGFGQYLWNFTLANSAVQFLGAGQALTLAYDLTVTDSHGAAATQRVNVTINGTNDVPVVSAGVGSVAEDTALTTGGLLTISDADAGEAFFVPQNSVATNYGTFTIDALGAWNYRLNNALPAVLALGAGDVLTDTVTVLTADGSSTAVTITVQGASLPSQLLVYGTSVNDVQPQIVGSPFADRIYGLTGTDVMSGGLGDDTYFVDGGDSVIESAGGGKDEVVSSVGYTLSAEVENLTLTGSASFAGGNSLDNLISIRVLGDKFTFVSVSPGAGNDIILSTEARIISGYDTNTVAQAVVADLASGVVLDGLGGSDFYQRLYSIRGGAGNDTFIGGGQVNSSGGDFIEIFAGLSGNDLINGGETRIGYMNRAEYSALPLIPGVSGTGIIANLTAAEITINGINVQAGKVWDGYGTTDTLLNINQITGSSLADRFYGGNQGLRSEAFEGGAGGDYIDGGAGVDEARYDNSPGGVVVDLVTGVARDGYGSGLTDTLVNIEDLRGSSNDDVLLGDANSNRFQGRTGNDFIDGRGGKDYADYSNSLESVDIYLDSGAGVVGDGFGALDTLINIEGVSGTNFDDVLRGGAGSQWFQGRGGSNVIDGGAGEDWVSYEYSPEESGVTVNLTQGVASNGWGGAWALGGVDTLSNIENLQGSSYADRLTGDSVNNRFDGLGGDDVIDGGFGQDTALFAGRFADYRITQIASGELEVADLRVSADADGVDRLSGIEILRFQDQEYVVGSGELRPVLPDTDNVSQRSVVIGSNSIDSNLAGTDAADLMIGRKSADLMSGGLGDDIYFVDDTGDAVIELAGGGQDEIISSVNYTQRAEVEILTLTGAATFAGGNSSDNLIRIRVAGDELTTVTVRPGAGNDTVLTDVARIIGDYSTNTAAQAVVADLATGVVLDGRGGRDVYQKLYTITGGAGDDSLTGGGHVKSDAGDFFEVFRGLAGNDQINGGETLVGFSNRSEYQAAPAGIVANISDVAVTVNGVTVQAGTVLDGYGTTDTLLNINQIRGSNFDDRFYGGDQVIRAEAFEGGAGADYIDGGAGVDEARYDNSTGSVVADLALGVVSDGYGSTDTLLHIENLRGSAKDDILLGDAKNNRIQGRGGNDYIDGRAGIDYADYSFASEGINAYLSSGAGFVSDGFGTLDTLINIEGITGTRFDDVLRGGAGSQWFQGRGGSNVIDGGAGEDWVSYENSPEESGVTVNLAQGVASNGWGGARELGGVDTLSNIENVQGSTYADRITGDSADNWLDGGRGDDVLTGGAGADRFIATVGGGVDAITDFELGAGGDVIDLSGLLTAGVSEAQLLEQYVSVTQNGSQVTVSVDADGNGLATTYSPVFVFESEIPVSAQLLLQNNQLLISRTNTAAVIAGTSAASLTESNLAQTASGLLSVFDADSPETFIAQSQVTGSGGFGQFTLTADGAWTYAMSGSHNEFIAGQTYTDSFIAATADGTTQVVKVNIVGTNDVAVITSGAAVSVEENSGGIVYTATASDPDSASLSFSLGGTDAELFNIDETSGAVSFKAAPDYESPADAGGNNVYDITVTASDGVNTSAEQVVAITVTDVQETTQLLVGQSVIDLGSYGKLIAPVQVDGGKWYYYWDRSGDGSAADTGHLNSGLDLVNHDVLDAIFKQDINGVVGGGGNTTDTYRYAILNGVHVALPSVGGVEVPPFGAFVTGSFVAGTQVGSVQKSDGSNAVNAIYDDYLALWDAYNGTGSRLIVDGTPPGWESISTSYWTATPTDHGHAKVVTGFGAVSLNYIDLDLGYVGLQVFFNDVAAPVITSSEAVSVPENSAGIVYTATASDPDNVGLNYSLGGTDVALFNINATTGAVSFKNAPSYEAPADVGGDNVYNITVRASDGTETSAAQAVAITVSDVYEAPPLAGQSVIDLGSYGKLIAPVQVDGGQWFYYWDRSGNGLNLFNPNTGTLNGGVDYTTHDVLDGIFNQDINGVAGGGGNTTDTYRYATLNAVRLALPSAGGQSSPPYGAAGNHAYQFGTVVGSLPAATGSNTVNATYNDLLAIWDAHNGTGTGTIVNGTPSDWQGASYWSATSSASGHAYVSLDSGYVNLDYGNFGIYVALQVLFDDIAGPVVTSPATTIFAENSNGVAYQATATDVDSAVLNYTIGGTDATLFNIDTISGVVSFKAAPDYETPADAGGNNVYDITVSASDGVNTSVAQGVAITVTDVTEYVSPAGQSVIDLGSYGKLIAPVQVDGGKWYYFWDRSGDGSTADTGNLNGGVDYTNHDVLDGIFTQDINGVVGGVGDTTDTYRYATLNGVRVALPTVGGVTSPPYGGGGISNYQPGTAIGSSPSTEGSNAVNVDYNDYLAIWDAYNGSGAGSANLDGAPPGWLSAGYWASTPTSVGHAGFAMFTGYIGNGSDDTPIYAALQVL